MDKEDNLKNRFVYIEVLRSVGPNQECNDFDYFLLGEFDAMRIHIVDDIKTLKLNFEKGQVDTPELFDRQPMFLYSDESMIDIDDPQSIFYRGEEYSFRPLIVTLFQLDKIKLANNESIKNPHDLIKHFDKIIKNSFNCANISHDNIKFQTLWNLGESDAVVLFRPENLRDLSKALYCLKSLNDSDKYIQIVSSSSHCAFPRPYGNIDKDTIKLKIGEWIRRELSCNNEQFITLTNVSNICCNPQQNASFIFGEWDYMYIYDQSNKENLVDSLTNVFFSFTKETEHCDAMTYYTIPVLKDISVGDNRSNPIIAQKHELDILWISNLKNSFEELIGKLRNVFSSLDQKVFDIYIGTLESFERSVLGICKYLFRLKEGRFEEDLYAYIKPIFVSYHEITISIIHDIDALLKEPQIDYIKNVEKLVSYYMNDTADLIGKLQHFFSIMAVSPHTFLETYGSNMRSLAASDKLLNSYQGIIRFLKETFPDKIDNQNVSHSILVLPYRGARSCNHLLFNMTNPITRISYIEIDFMKMFDIDSTVFMLIHECGHRLGDRLREERFDFYAKASLGMCFEWIGLETFLDKPLETFLMRLNINAYAFSIQDVDALFSCFKDKNRTIEEYNSKIRKCTVKKIHELVEMYSKDVKTDYENDTKIISKIQHKKYFIENVVEFFRDKYLPTVFNFSNSYKASESSQQKSDEMRSGTVDAITNTIGIAYQEIAKKLSCEIIKCSGNVYEALRLKVIFQDSKNFSNSLMDKASFIVSDKLEEGSLEKLGRIFDDIYSDIFAIRILGIDVDVYVNMILELIGKDADLLSDTPSIYRFLSVISAVWNEQDSRVCEILTKMSREDVLLKQVLNERWNAFRRSSYTVYLVEYAKKCLDKIDELVKTALNMSILGENPLHCLRKMFSSDIKGKINSVFYFCKYLMKG